MKGYGNVNLPQYISRKPTHESQFTPSQRHLITEYVRTSQGRDQLVQYQFKGKFKCKEGREMNYAHSNPPSYKNRYN